MACYRSGGCGPYEGRSCNECPASKPEYVLRHLRDEAKVLEERRKRACDDYVNKPKPPIKIAVFLSEDGVSCIMKNTDLPVEVEFIDEVTVAMNADFGDGEKLVDNYEKLLLGRGFTYVEEEKIGVIEDMGSHCESEEEDNEEG